jgi:phosphoglycolate phosphatase
MFYYMKFDGILLDIDGTIWDTTKIAAAAWAAVIKKNNYNIKITAEILKKEFGKTMDVIADDLFSSVKSSKRKLLLEQCCEEEHSALRVNTEKIEYTGVCETIKKVVLTHDFFIVSNCQKGYIELVMDKTGIAPYISDYECFGNTKKGKADNIINIVQRNSITEPVYIGDTQGDCDACKEAGLPFIWAAYGFGTPDSYYASIKCFSEIENLV